MSLNVLIKSMCSSSHCPNASVPLNRKTFHSITIADIWLSALSLYCHGVNINKNLIWALVHTPHCLGVFCECKACTGCGTPSSMWEGQFRHCDRWKWVSAGNKQTKSNWILRIMLTRPHYGVMFIPFLVAAAFCVLTCNRSVLCGYGAQFWLELHLSRD